MEDVSHLFRGAERTFLGGRYTVPLEDDGDDGHEPTAAAMLPRSVPPERVVKSIHVLLGPRSEFGRYVNFDRPPDDPNRLTLPRQSRKTRSHSISRVSTRSRTTGPPPLSPSRSILRSESSASLLMPLWRISLLTSLASSTACLAVGGSHSRCTYSSNRTRCASSMSSLSALPSFAVTGARSPQRPVATIGPIDRESRLPSDKQEIKIHAARVSPNADPAGRIGVESC